MDTVDRIFEIKALFISIEKDLMDIYATYMIHGVEKALSVDKVLWYRRYKGLNLSFMCGICGYWSCLPLRMNFNYLLNVLK